MEAGPTDRTGICISYRVRIYPPGITDTERRMLVLLHRWPALAAVLLLAVLTVAAVGATVVEFGTVTAIAIAAFVTLLAATRRLRRRSVTLNAMRYVVGGQEEVEGNLARIVHCVTALTAADEALASGSIDRVRYEAVWWQVYREAGAQPAGPGG